MSKRIVLSTATTRRQPLLQCEGYRREAGTTRLGEAVGGTAAVCCCFSFGLANMLYLAMYKVPLSLCQLALRKKRRRQLQGLKDGLVAPRRTCSCGCCDDIIGGGGRVYPLCCDDEDAAVLRSRSSVEKDKEVVALEKEMWDRFYGSGFWRSPSQRDDKSFPSQQRITYSAPRNIQE
ncbi:hypothetical protein CR513_34223, partial [Mucuna pruriens]